MIARLEQQEIQKSNSVDLEGIEAQDVIDNRENIREMREEMKELAQQVRSFQVKQGTVTVSTIERDQHSSPMPDSMELQEKYIKAIEQQSYQQEELKTQVEELQLYVQQLSQNNLHDHLLVQDDSIRSRLKGRSNSHDKKEKPFIADAFTREVKYMKKFDNHNNKIANYGQGFSNLLSMAGSTTGGDPSQTQQKHTMSAFMTHPNQTDSLMNSPRGHGKI